MSDETTEKLSEEEIKEDGEQDEVKAEETTEDLKEIEEMESAPKEVVIPKTSITPPPPKQEPVLKPPPARANPLFLLQRGIARVDPPAKEVPLEEEPVVADKPRIPLKVFLQIFGMKWDQIAGFKYYATKNKLGPCTVPEWRDEFEKFMNRPTR